MTETLLLDTCALLWLASGSRNLSKSSDDMLKAAELPWLHKDPADRFIIATALANNFTVVTSDGNFPRYGVRTIS